VLERKSPKSNPSKDFDEIPLLEAGDHDARLVYVADLGLQRKEYKGEFQGNFQQISLGLEIVGETVMIDDKEVPRLLWTRPFYIYDTLTEKGLEKKFFNVFDSSADVGEVPDWDSQLGKPCNVVVKNTEGKGENSGKTFNNVETISSIPAKYQDAIAENKLEPQVGMNEEIEEHLFGLAKYVFDKKIVQKFSAKHEQAEAEADY